MKTKSLKQLIEELPDDDMHRPVIQGIADQIAEHNNLLREISKDIKRLENRASAIERRNMPQHRPH